MYSFTNQFSGPTLRQRVGMMNSQRSKSFAWWRYGLWILVMGVMALACRHKHENNKYPTNSTPNPNALPANSPTRAIVVDLEDNGPWYRYLALFQGKSGTQSVQSLPVVLQLKGDQFILPDRRQCS
ncbi:hypothetical protein [Spirosoma areae]